MTQETPSKLRLPISEMLPLGYLYLLILGIVSDSIYYGMLGVNIMSFSGILDVLLSPVVQMTDNLIVPIFIIAMPLFSYFYILLMDRVTKRLAKSNKKTQKLNLSMMDTWLFFTTFIIFSAFIGMGVGKGVAASNKMKAGNLSVKSKITFLDGKSLDVRVIGNNSSYIFYVVKNGKSVVISPVQNNVARIEKLPE